MYASSRITKAGSLRIAKRSSSEMMLPSGLLGEVRKTIFAPCSSTASVTPAIHNATCFLLPLRARMQVCKGLHPYLPDLRERSINWRLPTIHIELEALQAWHSDNPCVVDTCIKSIHCEGWRAVHYLFPRV